MNAPVNGLKNRTWSELSIGDTASIEKRVTSRDLFLFAHASGNLNPLKISSFSFYTPLVNRSALQFFLW